MKKTDFTKATTDYLSHYLPEVRGLSNNTISSYRDTFKQLLTFYAEIKNIPANRMEIRFLTYNNVTSFLEWLEQERKVSISTRNQRQAAVQSFVRYLRYRYPEYLYEYHDILEMKAKKQAKPLIPFLTADELKSLLSQPDANSRSERRNLVMLTTLYDTGARVQELCDLTTDDIRLEKPSKIKLTGKGGKTRQVPIMRDTGRMLKQYMKEYHRFVKKGSPEPLFYNKKREPLTRSGVAYIVKKYAKTADMSLSVKDLTPHVFRHTKAMHMLQAGIELVYIRDFLGHSDIRTTEIYARADAEMKRKVFEKAVPNYTPAELMPWEEDDEDILSWLEHFGKPDC